MPLNMTKIAFGCDSTAYLAERLAARHATDGEVYLTTRYMPKRAGEMVGGSLYWIIAHRLVARSPITGFEPSPDGKTRIMIEPRVIPVASVARRAHQGWRYLKDEDAPRDLREGEEDVSELPADMAGELTRLGLV